MTHAKNAGNGRVRLAQDIRAFADWLAASMHTFESNHGNHRPLASGDALRLLLALDGHLPKPTGKQDIERLAEIRRILDAKKEVRT